MEVLAPGLGGLTARGKCDRLSIAYTKSIRAVIVSLSGGCGNLSDRDLERELLLLGQRGYSRYHYSSLASQHPGSPGWPQQD
jgi:hypothetical protein